jgi:hypothetical protein
MQRTPFLSAALVAVLFSSAFSAALCADDTITKPTMRKASKGRRTRPPSDQDIANAKSQGLVWIDPDARVYYKDGDLYGRTKRGKFALEDDAKKEGIFEAKETAQRTTKKRPDQSGIDSSIETHSSTPPKK